jgi:hypothetical protein
VPLKNSKGRKKENEALVITLPIKPVISLFILSNLTNRSLATSGDSQQPSSKKPHPVPNPKSSPSKLIITSSKEPQFPLLHSLAKRRKHNPKVAELKGTSKTF